MSTGSNILREYLIAFGVKVDPSAAAFDKQLSAWDKKATTLAKSLVGVGTAVTGMVTVFAYQMEKLYYTSQRTGAAIATITSLDYAGTRIGLTAGTITKSIESMAKSIRMNPAIQSVIEGLGVKGVGTGRDAGMVANDVIKALAKMPAWLGGAMAEQYFGIPEEVITQYRLNAKEQEESAIRQREIWASMGVDQQAAGVASKDIMNEWREVVEFGKAFVGVLSISILPMIRELSSVTKQVLQDWSGIVRKYSAPEGGGLGKFVKDVLDGLDVMVGFSPTFGDDHGPQMNNEQRHRLVMARKNGLIPQATVPGSGVNPFANGIMPAGGVPFAGDTLGLRQHNPGNIRPGGGWSSVHANGFESFDTDAQGLSAMAGQLLRYQERGIDTIADIVKTWAPASDGNDPKGYASNVAGRMGLDPNAHLDLNDASTLQALMSAMIRQEQGSNPFGAAQLGAATASRGVVIHQQTEVYVNGAGDPAAVAGHVADSMSDVNGDMVRNLKGAAR